MLNVFVKNNKPRTNYAIVLDLDETLVHTIYGGELDTKLDKYLFTIVDAITKNGEGNVDIIKGYKRKHLDDFLKCVFRTFKYIIVFSAGRPKYVKEMVKEIFKDHGYPNAIFTYDDCEEVNGFIVKRLEKIAKLFNIELESIIAIDDRISTATLNPTNVIIIPEFNGYEDDCLLKLIEFFDKLEPNKNITLLNKSILF